VVDLNELLFSLASSESLCFLFNDRSAPFSDFDFLECFEDDGGASFTSTSDSSFPVDSGKLGLRNLGEASCISSSASLSVVLPSAELEPIFPTGPSPKPIGRYLIFRPLGCCLMGFLAGTVARLERVSMLES